jgi:hypothetical protein
MYDHNSKSGAQVCAPDIIFSKICSYSIPSLCSHELEPSATRYTLASTPDNASACLSTLLKFQTAFFKCITVTPKAPIVNYIKTHVFYATMVSNHFLIDPHLPSALKSALCLSISSHVELQPLCFNFHSHSWSLTRDQVLDIWCVLLNINRMTQITW